MYFLYNDRAPSPFEDPRVEASVILQKNLALTSVPISPGPGGR